MYFKSKQVYFTTSWDDGNPADFTIANLLKKHGLSGTFYIPRTSEYSTMEEREIRSLASGFEIGGHTLNHAVLTRTEDDVARHEITDSKTWLELLLGRECEVFCFPQGKFNHTHVEMVRTAEYKGARTVELMASRLPPADSGLFIMPTTVQAMNGHQSAYFKNLVKRRSVTGLAHYLGAMAPKDWSRLARIQFDRILANGSGVFHLWGHSWELEEYQLWEQLDSFLEYIASHREEISVVSNSELCGKLQELGNNRPV